MALDFKKFDKTKLMVLVAAVAAGIVAVVLTNAHINRTIEEGSGAEKVAFLMEKVKALESAQREVMQSQEAYANRVEQELQGIVQQQQARPATQPVVEKPALKRQSLALKTPEGKRAITVNITTLAAVGGLLNPGDFVDVLAHLDLPTDAVTQVDASGKQDVSKMQKTTLTLFQNIQILAIGSNVDSPSDFDGQQKTTSLTITFAVDPEQAELLTFAELHGKLQLVLRSSGESSSYRLPSATWETLKNYLESTQGVMINSPVAPKKKEAQKEEPSSSIEIYRSGVK